MSVSQMLRNAAKLQKAGKHNQAKAIYQSILEKFPNNKDAKRGLAGSSKRPRKPVDPSDQKLNKLMGLYNAKEFQKAVDFGRALLSEHPDAHVVHNILGAIHMTVGNHLAALGHFQKVVAVKPDLAEGHNNLGAVYHNLRVPEESIKAYEAAIKLMPKYAQAHSNRNFELNYTTKQTPEQIFDKHMQYEMHFGGSANRMELSPDMSPDRPLRVGYVSPDFSAHSVAYFFEPLLAAHDRTKVETYCYYCATKVDNTTKRLQGYADHWRDVTPLDDRALARVIADDKIDILVDLAGHSAKSRIQMFAHKAAPIQVAWLGYPNTTGLKSVDYRFTDIIADPVGEADRFHSETLVRLDGGIWCYQGDETIPLPAPKTGGAITFGSFNHMSKLTPEVIKLWSDILNALPQSRLILKHLQLGNAVTRDTVAKQFGIHGIAPERLDLHAKLPKFEDHLALYGQVDIGLDPFPFNGCTTTFEALWMGVPVISLRGDRHVARVGASILTHLGHPELLAETPEGYVKLATELANDPARLASYREQLRGTLKSSPLGDAVGFTSKVEQAYREMWTQFARKRDLG